MARVTLQADSRTGVSRRIDGRARFLCGGRRSQLAGAILVLGATVACAVRVVPGPLGLNFAAIDERLATSGWPSADRFDALRAAGYEVVINLVPDGAHGAPDDERGRVERAGMRYVHVPVDFAAPNAQDFERFARILAEQRQRRVLVHCQANMRASSFVFLYRVVHESAEVDTAFDAVLRLWQPNAKWRAFIRDTLRAHGKALPLALA